MEQQSPRKKTLLYPAIMKGFYQPGIKLRPKEPFVFFTKGIAKKGSITIAPKRFTLTEAPALK